jgi:glyoxylase-like metal-dependent hydrolase (beta-lactamase superfamily II)
MEGKEGRLACYYIDSKDPILIEVGPSSSFPYLISALETIGIQSIKRSAITHLHLDHVGGIGHVVENYKDHFVYVHELGIKHLPNPERLWNAVADIYTEEWLIKNWGIIKPTPIENIKTLNDGHEFKLDKNRNLKSLYSPGHAKHHYTFYDSESGTIFMGDTLGLIYPHGDFVQPNLPPPDFNKDVLFDTLDKISSLELKQLAIAHFGLHVNPYELINNAYRSIDEWIIFIKNLPNTSNDEAADLLKNWVINNYEILNVDSETIQNYISNSHFLMQVAGIRNYLNIN